MKNQIELKILVSNPYNANIEKRLKQVEDFSERDELENHWKTIYENINNCVTISRNTIYGEFDFIMNRYIFDLL